MAYCRILSSLLRHSVPRRFVFLLVLSCCCSYSRYSFPQSNTHTTSRKNGTGVRFCCAKRSKFEIAPRFPLPALCSSPHAPCHFHFSYFSQSPPLPVSQYPLPINKHNDEPPARLRHSGMELRPTDHSLSHFRPFTLSSFILHISYFSQLPQPQPITINFYLVAI